MNKKKHLIFILGMSIIVALISFIPDLLVEWISIKPGYLIILIFVLLFLILVYYRHLDYAGASFKRLLTTGISILFFGFLLSFILEMGHLRIIGKDGVQKIIDRKVQKKIESETSDKFNIFKIEKDIAKRVGYNGAKDILSLIFAFLAVSLLVFIYSLILRTDKVTARVENGSTSPPSIS